MDEGVESHNNDRDDSQSIASPTMLQKKVADLLERDYTSEAVLMSLTQLSTFFDESSMHNRHNLGRIIEKRGMEQNLRFIDSLSGVIEKFEQMKSCIDDLHGSCHKLHADSQDVAIKGQKFSERICTLQEMKELSRQMELTAREFLSRYQLSAEQEQALAQQDVGQEFFAALDQLYVIQDRVKDLLSQDSHRAGVELMDSVAVKLETTLDFLCRSTSMKCRQVLGLNPDIPSFLKKSFDALRQRPAYFSYCTQELITIRKQSLLQAFVDALTKGGRNGMPRPIEIHAHNRLRYCSDMMAWIHQAIASERELAFNLYSNSDQLELYKRRSQHQDLDPSGEISRHVKDAFESLIEPLSSRIIQAVESENDAKVVFQISSLIIFYRDTFQNLAPGIALVSALNSIETAAKLTDMIGDSASAESVAPVSGKK